MMLSTGLIVKSVNGRTLSPAPRIDCTTDRKCKLTLDRVNEWLRKEAIEECKLLKNEFAQQMMELINIKNISKSDIDMMNMILFDE